MSKSLRFTGLLFAVLLLPLSAHAAAETYKLDPTHTAVTFKISHFGFSSPSGKFMNVDGKLVLDEANPAASSVSVSIPIDKIDTGVAKLDEHLKTDQFFNVAQFPDAKFVSTRIDVKDKENALVTGNLTLHGITKPITLTVKLNKIGNNMMNVKTAGFQATGTLKRSEYGMTTYLPNLGDDVMIEIESEANLDTPAAAAPASAKP